jgi:hypothetical protein
VEIHAAERPRAPTVKKQRRLKDCSISAIL